MGINKFNIKNLLEPYKDGGTESSPVERTIQTISGKLIVVNKIPPEIVGAAVFQTFYDIAYHGLEFKGDGSYGSAGRQLFQFIKAKCIELTQKDAAGKVVQKIMDMTACAVDHCPMRTRSLIKHTKWQRLKLWLLKPRGLWRL